MMLADMGAEVLKVDAAAMVNADLPPGPLNIPDQAITLFRGRQSIGVDLKNPAGVALVLELVTRADVLLEGYRPGVMERLGLGPDECLAANPALIYGRVTGYGQDGPLAANPGHDLNYAALSGMLDMIGNETDGPTIPLSLLGDFGGGGMLLTVGVLAALLERGNSGKGQVIDAAMVEGASLLGTLFHGLLAAGHFLPQRGVNLVDGGAHFYNVYRTRDDQWLSIAAVIEKFYRKLLADLSTVDPTLADENLPDQNDRDQWPAMKARFAGIFGQRTLAEWDGLLSGPNSCYCPVLGPLDAWQHPQHQARESFVELAGIRQPAPAPRFSRTPSAATRPPPTLGSDTRTALPGWGIDPQRIEELLASGAISVAE